MSEYCPDAWVLLKFTSTEYGEIYKILAGWYGGYLNGDSWKINSGVTELKDAGTHWEVHGYSGSIYKCGKSTERIIGITSGILNSLTETIKNSPGAELEVIDTQEYFDSLPKV